MGSTGRRTSRPFCNFMEIGTHWEGFGDQVPGFWLLDVSETSRL